MDWCLVVMQIQDDPRNRQATQALVDAFRRRQGVIPFVGAGLSVDFGFPLWTDFLREAAAQAGRRTEVEAALADHDYELAAQHLEASLGKQGLDSLIVSKFAAAVDAGAAPQSAVHLLPELAGGPVITTNFDRVLETVFRSRGRAFDLPPLWGARTQIALDGIAEDYSLLLKLHGDAVHGGDRVLTSGEYERHYGGLEPRTMDINRPLPKLLERLFASRSVLFLGCSLDHDRTLAVLAGVARATETVPHFAVVEEPASPAELAERVQFFSSCGLLPLWYPQKCYGLLRQFLEFLRAQVPPAAAGYRGIPSSITAPRLAEEIRRIRDARRVLGTRGRERDRLLNKWDRIRDPDGRAAFFRQHRGRIRDFWPPDFIRLAVQLVEQIRTSDPVTAADYLISAHRAASSIGDTPAAKRFLRRAASLLDREEPGITHTALLHTRSLAAKDSGAIGIAEKYSRQSLRLAARIRLTSGVELRIMWHLRSNILRELGRHRHSQRYLAKALRSARSDRDDEALAHCWFSASNLYFHQDAPEKMVRASLRAANHTSQDNPNLSDSGI
jgi:tetratricopeptide (TPR) repeat protein